ncbi:hypothetical protein SLEP1_g6390 [Rubroshorea leprosula]|uniref:Uncharacterized protein n=1 Tax=Rubroshorea leprosula TaxID=152421 RepID=A0AAV5I500_9ROSI|nr:hypothetical protein SLEP1_g6390 [Rubroshorea leprosula]
MLTSRTSGRVSVLSKMIANLNQFLPLSPVACERSNVGLNPSSISLKVRYFRGSRLLYRPKVSSSESIQSPCAVLASQGSRLAKTKAQGVLFDYLHYTRSLSFTDAEHISKNSPYFIKDLLSKVDNEQDVSKSLSKFLRYNPINEFEPFFESLGLSPSEVPLLLPRHLMYLTDDGIMLENFHVLCGYGIPHSKIGKMYKEAREILEYDYGVLTLKLQAYENLGLSKATVIKLVGCCPRLLVGDVDHNFVQVLHKLRGLGIKNDGIGRYLSGRDTYDWSRVLNTINFLDKVGCTEKQFSNFLKTNPALVFEGSGKKFYVLFGRLLKLGLEKSEVYSLFIQNPKIFSVKCINNLLLALDFLFAVGMRVEDIAFITSGYFELMSTCSLKSPKTMCRELKVGRNELSHIIMGDPSKFFNLASKSSIKGDELVANQNPSNHLEKNIFLLSLGYTENSEEMMKALKKFRGRGDQLQERFDCLVEAGLDCNAVKDMIRHAPTVLNQSKGVIQEKIDYLKNRLHYPLEFLVSFPTYLCYDMERINLRFSMYMWLVERGVAKPRLSLSTLLASSDARFVKYFVDIHPEGPAMWETLKKSLCSS